MDRSYEVADGEEQKRFLADKTKGKPLEHRIGEAEKSDAPGKKLHFYENLLIMHDAQRDMRTYCRHDAVDLYINKYINVFLEARDFAQTPRDRRLLYATVRSFFLEKDDDNKPAEYRDIINHIEKILSKKDRIFGASIRPQGR
jgi:hypothetical protein